jgi:prepilin peptidase CpaA
VQVALFTLLSVALLVCAVSDWRLHLIPDVVLAPTLVLGLGVRFVYEGWGDLEAGLASGLIAAVLCAALFGVVAWFNRGFGAGDVKLMLVVGACLGVWLGAAAVLFTTIAGALQAVLVVIWQGAGKETVDRMLRPASNSSATRRHIPYGVAIAVGSAWAMWWAHANVSGN